jgi:hypothetical protein
MSDTKPKTVPSFDRQVLQQLLAERQTAGEIEDLLKDLRKAFIEAQATENPDPLQPSPRVFAAQWLRDLLQREPRWVEDLFRWAQEDGISIATLKRAKKSINAKSVKSGGYFGGEDTRWFWRLG